MTRDETAMVVMKLHGAYFSQDRVFNSKELENRIDIWDVFFKDFTFKTVNQAVTEWIGTQKTMPQISELLPRCKDLRILEQGTLADASSLRPTWDLIWESHHGELRDEDIPPEIRKMTDDFIRWLRADPKMKAKYKAEQNRRKPTPTDSADLGECLPYEI